MNCFYLDKWLVVAGQLLLGVLSHISDTQRVDKMTLPPSLPSPPPHDTSNGGMVGAGRAGTQLSSRRECSRFIP